MVFIILMINTQTISRVGKALRTQPQFFFLSNFIKGSFFTLQVLFSSLQIISSSLILLSFTLLSSFSSLAPSFFLCLSPWFSCENYIFSPHNRPCSWSSTGPVPILTFIMQLSHLLYAKAVYSKVLLPKHYYHSPQLESTFLNIVNLWVCNFWRLYDSTLLCISLFISNTWLWATSGVRIMFSNIMITTFK